MAIRREMPHLRVARVPHRAAFGIEPDEPATALIDLLQHVRAWIAVVVASIPEHDDGRAAVDLVETQTLEVGKRLTVVRGAAAVLAQGERDRVLDSVSRECLGDLA